MNRRELLPMIQPRINGRYFSAQVTFATEQRVSIALHVCDTSGDGGALHLELTSPPATKTRWHAERVRCDHGTPVTLEFLRDFFDALHWGLTRDGETALTLSDVIAFLSEWEPSRR